MLAFPACHVVAPAVLFDRRVAPRALLGVGGDPVRRFRVILAFLEPLFHQWTRRRLVVVERAAKAEVVFAPALYRRHNPGEVTLFDGAIDSVLAIRSWAPLKILLVIDVGSGQKRLIPAKNKMKVNHHAP